MTIQQSRERDPADDPVFIRLQEVRRITGLCTTTIYARAARGEFPRQIKIGPKSVAWVKAEVMNWCRDRIARNRSSSVAPAPLRAVNAGKTP